MTINLSKVKWLIFYIFVLLFGYLTGYFLDSKSSNVFLDPLVRKTTIKNDYESYKLSHKGITFLLDVKNGQIDRFSMFPNYRNADKIECVNDSYKVYLEKEYYPEKLFTLEHAVGALKRMAQKKYPDISFL